MLKSEYKEIMQITKLFNLVKPRICYLFFVFNFLCIINICNQYLFGTLINKTSYQTNIY